MQVYGRGKQGAVACQEVGTTSKLVLPWAWDHRLVTGPRSPHRPATGPNPAPCSWQTGGPLSLAGDRAPTTVIRKCAVTTRSWPAELESAGWAHAPSSRFFANAAWTSHGAQPCPRGRCPCRRRPGPRDRGHPATHSVHRSWAAGALRPVPGPAPAPRLALTDGVPDRTGHHHRTAHAMLNRHRPCPPTTRGTRRAGQTGGSADRPGTEPTRSPATKIHSQAGLRIRA